MGTQGLSKPRLERMHQVLSGFIERKEMPGMVALISHHDDVHISRLAHCRSAVAKYKRRFARSPNNSPFAMRLQRMGHPLQDA
jgi:hypothetical protein